MGDFDKASKLFLSAISESKLTDDKLNSELQYSLLGLTFLNRNTEQGAYYNRLCVSLYQKILDSGDTSFGDHYFNVYFGLATTKLNHIIDNEQISNSQKDEVLDLLSKAKQTGFRDAQFLESNPFFAVVKNDPDFIAFTAEIKQLNQIELEKLKTEL